MKKELDDSRLTHPSKIIRFDTHGETYKYEYKHCTFNLKNKFVLCGESLFEIKIWIYSTRTKNNDNKWICERSYKLPLVYLSIFYPISIKYDKLFLFSDNSIYEWDTFTEKVIKIFGYHIYKEEELEEMEIEKVEEIKLKEMKMSKEIEDIEMQGELRVQNLFKLKLLEYLYIYIQLINYYLFSVVDYWKKISEFPAMKGLFV